MSSSTIDCCGSEDQNSSTFGQIVSKCQSWIFTILNGDIFSRTDGSVENTENLNENEETQNVIVSILFLIHGLFHEFVQNVHYRELFST